MGIELKPTVCKPHAVAVSLHCRSRCGPQIGAKLRAARRFAHRVSETTSRENLGRKKFALPRVGIRRQAPYVSGRTLMALILNRVGGFHQLDVVDIAHHNQSISWLNRIVRFGIESELTVRSMDSNN